MDVPTVMSGGIAKGRVRIASVAATRIKQLLLSTALAGIVVYPQALLAQSWNGAVDADFSNGANWSTGVAPTSTDVSTIASTPTTPVVAATTANSGQITMSGATLGINAGATLVLNTLTLTGASSVTGAGAIATNLLHLDSGSVGTDVTLATLATMGGGTFGGAISGAGQLLVSSGFNFLTGANTYSGATRILNGTLQTSANNVLSSASALTISAGATLELGNTQQTVASLAGAGTINVGASSNGFTFGADNSSTSFSGTVTGGFMRFYKEGTGTFSFSGTGPTSGAMQVDGGTLALAGTADFSGASVNLQANTTLDISGANAGISIKGLQGGLSSTAVHLGSRTLTVQRTDFAFGNNFSGVIDGSGGLTVGQNSTLNLFGVNTYTGPTTLSSASATLDLRHVSAIAASSEVDLAASGATLGISNAGGDATIQSLRGVAGSILTLRNNNLVITHAASDFAGIIKPAFGAPTGGVILNGGHQTLSGINTYLGATTVEAGTLSVNGSIASSSLTTVNTGGTLGGNGIVGNTTINGGALAPGNSIGTLNVSGNLVFTAASSYMVEFSPTTADRTNVTGTATLGGATVNASFAAGSYVEKQYTILNATGGIVGTFGPVVNSNLPSGFKSSLGYDANNAYLKLVLDFTPTPPAPPTPTPPVSPLAINSGLNGNQTQVANALSGYFARTGSIPIVFGGLTAAGLSLASGETPTGAQQSTFNAMNLFMGVLTDPFSNGRAPVDQTPGAMSYAAGGTDARSNSARDAHAMMTKAVARPSFEPRWVTWAAGFGGAQTTDGNATLGSTTATSRLYGIAAGADYWLSPQTVAGFAMAGGATSFGLANGLGSGRSDLIQAGGFVRHSVGAAYLTAAAAYGWQDITTERSVAVGGINQLQGRFNAHAFSGRLEAGHRSVASAFGGIGLTPYAATQVTAFELPAYAEQMLSGANAFALSYASKTVTATRSEFGLRSDKSYAVSNALLTLRGRAAWAHDFNAERSIAATFQALPGASFVADGARPARDAALTTVSAEIAWLNGLSLAAAFEGEFSDITRSYAGKGTLRYIW
ncbi:autotransporter domain-containing protein [Rhodopseudomonas palustris]|nr:autotransporter domain-containing protein [Rhodopseudomonas palustris]